MRTGLLFLLLSCGGADPGPRGAVQFDADPQPHMGVSSSVISFGPQVLGQIVESTLWVSNRGLGTLQLETPELEGEGFALFGERPVEVPPDEEVLFTVRYTPTTPNDEGLLRIRGDDPERPSLAVILSGSVAPGQLEVPEEIDLGSARIGCSATAEWTVKNVGGDIVTLDRVYADTVGLDVTLEETEVAPGESIGGTVVWEPTSGSGVRATVSLVTSVGTHAFSVTGVYDQTSPSACTELRVYNRIERADLIWAVDVSAEASDALVTVIDDVVDTFHASVEDLTVGAVAFSDYGATPPVALVRQQTDELGGLGGALAAVTGPSTSSVVAFEAVVQAGQGYGYDLDCDGVADPEDVQPFRVDSLFDVSTPTYDPTVSGTGPERGTGTRVGAVPIVVLVTDRGVRSPVAGDLSPGGCPEDADLQECFEAWAYGGLRFVAVGSDPLLELLAAELLAHIDLDDDGRFDDLAVVPFSSDPEVLDATLDDVLRRVVGGQPGATLTFAVDGPATVTPDVARELPAGEEVVLLVKADAGVFVSEPTETTEDVTVTIFLEDRVVATRVLYLEP